MSLTDPVANYLTLIRNALQAKHLKVDIPCSRLLVEMTRILKDEGYISTFKTIDEGSKRFLRIYLRYGPKGERVISGLQRVSRPGCRVYASTAPYSLGFGEPGNQHSDDAQGCIDREQGATARDWRRGALLCLVAAPGSLKPTVSHVTNRKKDRFHSRGHPSQYFGPPGPGAGTQGSDDQPGAGRNPL